MHVLLRMCLNPAEMRTLHTHVVAVQRRYTCVCHRMRLKAAPELRRGVSCCDEDIHMSETWSTCAHL